MEFILSINSLNYSLSDGDLLRSGNSKNIATAAGEGNERHSF